MLKFIGCIGLGAMLMVTAGYGSPASQSSQTVTVTGVLQTSVQIGGEGTGWTIHLDHPLVVATISETSIDVAGDNGLLKSLTGDHVQASGKIGFRKTVERGQWPVLEISSIRKM